MGTNSDTNVTAVGPAETRTNKHSLAQPHMNIAFIAGRLVNDPEKRTLPSGSVAMSFSLTVRAAGEKTTSVPAVWYDPPKRVDRWVAGDDVVVLGTVVRRFFRTGAGLGSATEVVVHRCELVRHPAKAATVRAHAQALLGDTKIVR